MSGRRRRMQGRGTHAENPATADGRVHQCGRGRGEGGSSGEPSAADAPPMVAASKQEPVGGGIRDVRAPPAAPPDDGGLHLGSEGGRRCSGGGSAGEPSAADAPMVCASKQEGVGSGGGDARTPPTVTPDDGGLHLSAEGGEEGIDAVPPGAAAMAIAGQPRTAAARTAEELQCQFATTADGRGRDGSADTKNDDQALFASKARCLQPDVKEQVDGDFLKPTVEELQCQFAAGDGRARDGSAEAVNFPPLQFDVKEQGGCDSECVCTLAEEKEAQVVAADGGDDGDQVMNSWKPDVKEQVDGDFLKPTVEKLQCQFAAADGRARDGAAEAVKFPPLQFDVKDQGGCESECVCTLAEEKEAHVVAADGGNDGDQVINSWKNGCFVLHAVLNWRAEHVMAADLFKEKFSFKEKVQKIPSTFTSVQQYIEIHSIFLLEETHANIQLGLLDLAKRPRYDALSISQTANPYVFFIDIDLTETSNCSHIAEDGDLFLLSTQPHGEFSHASVCFAIAFEIGRYSCFQKGFRVLVSEYQKEVNFRAIKHATFLTNIMGGITLSKAMTSIDRGGSAAAIESTLQMDEKEVCSCGALALDEFSLPNKFNDKQRNAMKCILSKLRCKHVNAPQVLWGPPGSGKTEVAATLLHSLFQWKFRVLVCVPTEKNIDMFLGKLSALFPSFDLSDILVLNDMNSVENCNTFSKMSLETRAQELYCCTYTWRSWMKELCFVLEMKPYCKDRCYHEGRTCKAKNLMIFCLESFREKICALIFDLRKCSEDLIRSLSGKYLLENDVAKINKLMTELLEFKNLMLSDSLTSSNVQWAFEFPCSLLVSQVANRDVAESMNAKRMSCLRLMEILIDSFELPQLEDRKNLENFYLGHSNVIICTPSYSSRLLELKLTPFDALLVDDASQIKEIDLFIPLSLAPKNVVLLGDHLHSQPMVKSEVCKKGDYDSSLFERLLNLSSEKMMLTKQYMMHPSVSLFVREHFYKGKAEDAGNVLSHDYNKALVDEKLSPYCFLDIMDVDELRVKGKCFVECAVIISLLQRLCKGLKNEKGKLSVAVLCLCRSRLDAIKNRLGTMYASHDRINLEVNTLDNANEDWYDIVIVSSIFDAKSELPQGNRINTALTKSRHCLWIVCEGTDLLESGGTWEILVKNAKDRGIFGKMTSKMLSNAMKMLEANDQKRPTATNSAFTGNSVQKPGKEWTWNGRPNNTKDILGSLRDQKNARDTCTLQATLTTTESLNKYEWSCLDPPQDFPWELCFKDLKSKYEKVVNEEIAAEEIGKKRGKYRQETAFEIAKTQGIIGRCKTETKKVGEERLFKLESYERVDKTLKAEEAEALVEAGSIMACNFRLSRNYFRLRPGDVYVYDKRYPYIHPISGLPVSHAVTVVGHGGQPSPEGQVRHANVQNSEGKRFGDGGFGRVGSGRDTVRGVYRLTLPPLTPPAAGAAPSLVGPAAANN